MKSLPLVVLALLCSFAAAEERQSRLEITEYRLPRVERIQGDSVIGYWEPGWLEFEAYVGRPTREFHGVNSGKQVARDSLTEEVIDPRLKNNNSEPIAYIQGNIWTRKVSDENQQCDIHTLYRNDTIIYRLRDCIQTESPHFYIREDHWWAEVWLYRDVEDTREFFFPTRGFQVIADGELLSDIYGYTETFDYHYVGDKPFFLFLRDSTFGWNYDGVETISNYDDVFHGQCCEPACSNPRFFADEFSFYARRDSVWYLVAGRIKE